MRLLYTALLSLATPFILLRLWWRGRALPAYRERWGERFGRVPPPPAPIAVWVHAVSVGESLAALPLIERLVARHGERAVWVTTTTPTGSARVQAALGDRVCHSYVPYDLPSALTRFLARVRPQRAVVMETELWPNLFAALARQRVPLLIANARLSPRSFAGYQRIRGLVAQTLACASLVAAQSDEDAQRFRALGAPSVETLGNLKYDLAIPAQAGAAGATLRAQMGRGRPVWLAASTHPGEDEIALRVHRRLLAQHAQALLILVPRHPQRFDAVGRLCEGSGLIWRRRSTGDADARTQVLLGDSMGEMFVYLSAADLAFVGGSLVPVGGHNVLEPAALGRPVLFGPHMHNFEGARGLLLGAGAAREVADEEALARAVAELMADTAAGQRMGDAGRAAVAANRGALERLLERIDAARVA